MLRVLFTLLFFVGLGIWALARVKRWLGSGPERSAQLSARERSRVKKLARTVPAMRRALELRGMVQAILEDRDDPAQVRERVDVSIRRLCEQLRLRGHIEDALDGAATTEDLADDPWALEERETMLAGLRGRLTGIDRGTESTLRELSKIHLSLLALSADHSASEAEVERFDLGEALEELAQASFEARSRVEAEQELKRLTAGRRALPTSINGPSGADLGPDSD